jgi:hypothetical protein
LETILIYVVPKEGIQNKIISSREYREDQLGVPKSAFPLEVREAVKNLQRRRGRFQNRRRSFNRRRIRGGFNRKMTTKFRTDHGTDLVSLIFTDFEMVDIQNKIKELLILTKMRPLDLKKYMNEEIFNAKINISINFSKYDLKNGSLEYELKKSKKNNNSKTLIDCKKLFV